MPQYTVRDEASGRTVTFDWAGADPPSETDMAEVFAAAGETPDTPTPMASHAPAEAPRRSVLREQLAMMENGDVMPVLPGLAQIGPAAVGPLKALATKLAPKLMRNALGAQEGIRNKFPTVNLEQVAMREGAVPGATRSITAVSRASAAANQGIDEAARAADAAGAAPIQPRQIVTGFRRLYDRAGQARLPEDQAEIVKAAKDIGRRYRGGVSRADSVVAKQEWANRAKGTLQGAADPRTANVNKNIARAVTKGLTAASHADPGVSQALTRAQELMALDKAMTRTGRRTSILRDALAAAAGTTAGMVSGGPAAALVTTPAAVALNRTLTSPQTLGRLSNTLSRYGQRPATGELQSLLAQLMASHAQD